jgi:ABC-type bacteriocin/lantibiotic exporter with double-glycine peptidase domain
MTEFFLSTRSPDGRKPGSVRYDDFLTPRLDVAGGKRLSRNPVYGGRHTGGQPARKVPPKQALREFQDLIWPRRGLLAGGLVLVLINRVASLVLPGSVKYLIDDIVTPRNLALLTPLVVVVGVAILVQAATSFSLTMLLSISAQRLITDMRVKIQRHVGRLPIRYFDQNKTGALVTRVMSDVEGVRNLIGTGLVNFLGGLITSAMAFFLLLRINVPLTLISLGFMLVFGLILMKAFGTIRPVFRERGKIRAEVTGRLTESFGGIRVVKGFHAEGREAATFSKDAGRLFENVKKTMTATALVGFASTLLMGMVSVTVMIVGGRQIIAGNMSVGDFFAYTLYMGFMVAPFVQVVSIGSQLTEAVAGLDRVREVLAEVPEDVDDSRVRQLDKIDGHIVFDNVTFEYDAGEPVLHGISLEAKPGTVTALAGSSGSGKSTLIGLVAAFAKPTEGSVTVDGIDLSTVSLDSFRSRLGVVLQDNFLFDGTIRNNILFGRPDASTEDVVEAARVARVDEFALKMPEKYETIIGERGVKLSGGQRQRVAIARAILANPRILILDEATSSLDSESEAYIQEGLSALMSGRTTFVIAHRLSTIRKADQILILEDGQIAERGTHDELLGVRGRYFDLYTRQAGLEANRFINPGETDPETPDEEKKRPAGDTSPLTMLRPQKD